MPHYAFYEIHYTEPVVSSYEVSVPEIDIRSRVYEITGDLGEPELICHILTSFDFRSDQKSLYELAKKVVDKIKIYESCHDLDSDSANFIERLHSQNYLHGVLFPTNFNKVLSTRDIIVNACKLGMIHKKHLIKYLQTPSSDGEYEYRLEKTTIETC